MVPILRKGWLHHLEQRVSHFRRGRGHTNAGVFESFDFRGGGPLPAADDGSRVTHPAAGRSGSTGNESGDRLFAMLLFCKTCR